MPLQFKARPSPGVQYFNPGIMKIVMKESLFAEVEVVATDVFTCNGLTSPNPAIISPPTLKFGTATSKSQVWEFYALNVGAVRLEATTLLGGIVYHLDVKVDTRRGSKTILKLESALAVEPEKAVETFNIDKLVVPSGRLPADIVKDIAKKGHHRHLFFSCHQAAPNILDIGAGFKDTDGGLFSALHGLADTIWLGACAVSGHGPGEKFARDVARAANSWVVVPMFSVPVMYMTGRNEIEAFTNSNCEVYPPGSPTRISEASFFFSRAKRGFTIARIGATSIGR